MATQASSFTFLAFVARDFFADFLVDLRFRFGLGRFLDLPLLFLFRNPMMNQAPMPITAAPPAIGTIGGLELFPFIVGGVGFT